MVLLAFGELSAMIITPVLNNYKNERANDSGIHRVGKNYSFAAMCGLVGVLAIP